MFSKNLEINEYNISEAQLHKLEELHLKINAFLQSNYKQLIPKQDFYTNIDCVLRFLTAREFDSNKAFEMWKKWVDWRLSYKPDQISIEEDCIKKQLEAGKLQWHKTDKGNRPCLYYRMKYHIPNLADLDNNLRFLVYMIEKGCCEADKLGSRQICVIYDRRGYSKKQHDPNSMKAMKLLIPILQDYYPERLHCYYVMGANWFFRAMFTVVKTFLSEKTANKVKVLAADTDLLNYFEKHKLLTQYGGSSEAFGQFGEGIKEGSTGKIGGSKGDVGENDDEDFNEDEQKKMAQEMMKDFGIQNSKVTLLKENSFK